ncbi:MAG: hypothetical protein V4574_03820 [Pseudomonadota bacterium]
MKKPRNRNPSGREHSILSRGIEAAPPEGKSGLLKRFLSLRLVWKIALGALAVFGAYASWLSIRPRVDITIADNRFWGGTPPFTISNNGFLSAYDVKWDCDGWVRLFLGSPESQAQTDFQWEQRTDSMAYADIGTLNGWGSAVRKCPALKLPPGASLTNGTVVVAVVTYNIPLWPFRQQEAVVITLEGEKDAEGHWEYQGEALDDAQAERLRSQGYDVRDLSAIKNSHDD